MDGNVVSSHIWDRFSSALEEAEKDGSISSQIKLRFQSIKVLIVTMMYQESGNTVYRLDLFQGLVEALSECTIFAQEASSKKGFNFFRVQRFENKMKIRLDKIKKELEGKIGVPDHQYHSRNSAPSGSGQIIQQTFPDPSLIMGFESEVSDIEKLLMPMDVEEEADNQFKAIKIVGRCGSGKTTLARMVFGSSRVANTFSPRIWVTLPEGEYYGYENMDLRARILKHILREAGHEASDLEYGDYSVVDLLGKLRLRLMGKRYLIVLDDASLMPNWFMRLKNKNGYPGASTWFTHGLPKEWGGAVILTIWNENGIISVEEKKNIIRPRLSDEFCWTIFTDAVQQQRGEIEPTTLIQIKNYVIDNCQGRPLAAKILATAISDLLAENSGVQS